MGRTRACGVYLSEWEEKPLVHDEGDLTVDHKYLHMIGCAASIMSILMYLAYLPQLLDNIAGQKANFLQPLVAAVNAMLWLSYGAFRRPKPDWPLVAANVPGVILGTLTAGASVFC